MTSAIELLIAAAKMNGERIAVKDSHLQISYNELLRQAFLLSNNIMNLITDRNRPIMIISNKSAESIIAVWGVLCSRNYYVAIDSKTPKSRRDLLINELNPALVIVADNENSLEIVDIPHLFVRINKEDIEEIQVIIDILEERKGIDTDPLYMVFTSGSTGSPKAIVKSHRSMLSFADSFINTFGLSRERQEVFGNQANFDFDVAAKDIYISVALGATLCLLPSNCFLIPKKLAHSLEENKITVLIWAASAVKFIARFNCFKDITPSHLRYVFFSGETMQGECIKYWRDHLDNCTYVNMYAPSEVTGNCLYHVVTDEKYEHILPLDKTFDNIEVLVINESGNRVSEGEKGEIFVRGSFLSNGYYRDFNKTNKVFIQNPLHNDYPDIVYRTGDYVKKQEEKLYFVGRIDNQIKHMGHRIELEEIETYIYASIPGYNFCVIYDVSEEKIIVLTDNRNLSLETIVNNLKKEIPKYMIPHDIVYIPEIPLNNRGKLDRKKAYSQYEVMK